MHYLVGACFIGVGLIIVIFGDRVVESRQKSGVISKLFAWPENQVKYMKWPMGAGIVGVGIWFIVYGAGKV